MAPKNALLLFILIVLIRPAYGISKGYPVFDDDAIRPLTVSVYGDHDDCTGVKVAASFVLTARHCEIDMSTRIVFAGGSSYKIAQYFVPDEKANSGEDANDLALIRIEGEVPGPVAELADDATTPRNGSTVWVAGYGGKKITKRDNPLRKLAVAILDRDYSSSLISVRTTVDGAICDGDSGGPGYIKINNKIVLWGIDSGADGDFKCASIELYSKVTSHSDWIKGTIAGNYKVSRKN